MLIAALYRFYGESKYVFFYCRVETWGEKLRKHRFFDDFFYFSKSLKISDVLKKFKNSCNFSIEMFCQFKNLPYLCTRFRQATRQRADERTATIDP